MESLTLQDYRERQTVRGMSKVPDHREQSRKFSAYSGYTLVTILHHKAGLGCRFQGGDQQVEIAFGAIR